MTIETIHFPDLTALPAADLVYAGYSLPYIHPDDFARVWGLIRSRLRPDAWFAGNFGWLGRGGVVGAPSHLVPGHHPRRSHNRVTTSEDGMIQPRSSTQVGLGSSER